MGLPTTSQYSSKVSPVSFVSDMGDFTNPAGEEEGFKAMETGQGRRGDGKEERQKRSKIGGWGGGGGDQGWKRPRSTGIK